MFFNNFHSHNSLLSPFHFTSVLSNRLITSVRVSPVLSIFNIDIYLLGATNIVSVIIPRDVGANIAKNVDIGDIVVVEIKEGRYRRCCSYL